MVSRRHGGQRRQPPANAVCAGSSPSRDEGISVQAVAALDFSLDLASMIFLSITLSSVL